MTKSSSFFENSRNPNINGGTFVHTENRVTQRRENVYHGPIYGYMHTATNDGPVIGYYNQVSIDSDVRQRSPGPGSYQRGHGVSLIENGTQSDIIHDEPEPMTLADMRINPGGDRSLAGPELPLELEDEFQSLSQEMQRYIKSLLNTRKSGKSVSDLSMVKLDLPRRAPLAQITKPSTR